MGEEKVDGFSEVLKADTAVETTTSETTSQGSESSQPQDASVSTDANAVVTQDPAAVAKANTAQSAPVIKPQEPMVPLKALTETRQKYKEARDRLQQYESGNSPTYEPPTQVESKVLQLENKMDATRLSLSEGNARRNHNDYQEMQDLFISDVNQEIQQSQTLDPENPNSALYQQIMNAVDPGEAVYQYGKLKHFHQKYGSDPESWVKNISAEAEKKAEERIRKEVDKQISDKISARNQNPTNILSTGVSNGTVEPRLHGWGDVLGKNRMRS